MLHTGKDNDQEPLIITEAYSGEDVCEYAITKSSNSKVKRHILRQSIHNARALFTEIFMPQGYPQTVSPDYLDYQRWDTIQAFASSQNAALATLAVLKGVGVGNEQATVLAAALTWLLKDGVGMIARIFFAWSHGSKLDSDNKRWRLVADFLNDASFMFDLLAPNLTQLFFTPLACFAAFLRAIVDVCGRTTRMAVIRHQARRDNLADVAAKDGSQETLINVFSLICSLILLPAIEGHSWIIWFLFVLLTFLHMFANYRAVKSLQFNTLNQARFQIAVKHFIKYETAISIPQCNADEPIFIRSPANHQMLHLGCSFDTIPMETNILTKKMGNNGNGFVWTWTADDSKSSNGILCIMEQRKNISWMVIEEDAGDEEIFNALFSIEHFFQGKGWPSENTIFTFRQKMASQGWSLQTNQLNIDEWRFRKSDTKIRKKEK